MMETLTDPEIWKYLSIPVIAALIGWITNWLAIKLTFYPLNFIGIPPFLGWQGIIPSKAEKMARISVDATISKIGTVQEISEYIDPRVLSQYIVNNTIPRTEEYVHAGRAPHLLGKPSGTGPQHGAQAHEETGG